LAGNDFAGYQMRYQTRSRAKTWPCDIHHYTTLLSWYYDNIQIQICTSLCICHICRNILPYKALHLTVVHVYSHRNAFDLSFTVWLLWHLHLL